MRRLLLFIAMIMVLATVLLGCGEEKKEAAPPESPKQEQKQEAKVESINVVIEPQVKNDGKNLILQATTNLPEGTKVSFKLTNKYTKLVEMGHDENFDPNQLKPEEKKTWENSTYEFSEFVFVKDGKLTTKAFPAEQLKSGKAELSVIMVYPQLQSDEVKKVMGEKGENLKGDLVKGKNVAIEKKIDI